MKDFGRNVWQILTKETVDFQLNFDDTLQE